MRQWLKGLIINKATARHLWLLTTLTSFSYSMYASPFGVPLR